MKSLIIPKDLLGKVIVSKERIQSTVKRIAKEIYYSRDYVGKVPILLCVKKGAVPFFKDLTRDLKELGFEFNTGYIDTHHIYEGTQSTGDVEISPYKGPNLEGRVVIIVEDIIDSSETMKRICRYLDGERGGTKEHLYTSF